MSSRYFYLYTNRMKFEKVDVAWNGNCDACARNTDSFFTSSNNAADGSLWEMFIARMILELFGEISELSSSVLKPRMK